MKKLSVLLISAIIFIFTTSFIYSAGQNDVQYSGKCKLHIPQDAKLSFEEIARFDVPNANQGVGVDRHHFYAVNNQVITKHNKMTGEEVARWEWDGPSEKNPIIHLDSAAVIHGKIYCAHSNWPEWPMTSSIEIWDAETMEHIGSHSFGIMWGSCTWVDWHDGYWWATFANYNRFQPRPDPNDPGGYDVLPGDEDDRTFVMAPYGYKRKTTLVKFTDKWIPLEAWVLPNEILVEERTGNMSNSGGSWGPDGYLYLTGHDGAEVYKCKLPNAGSILEFIEIIPLRKVEDPQTIGEVSIRGQGIAWDRSDCDELYGIIRATSAERQAGDTHKVTVSKLIY